MKFRITKTQLFWHLVIAIIIFIGTRCCLAATDPNYPDIVVSKYIRNYDADTITVTISHWPAIIGKNISIRVNGIDAPEIRGGTAYSKRLAKQAKIFVRSMLMNTKKIILKNPKRGKYFRIVADVELDGCDLGKLLVKLGYAKVYDGKTKRPDWSIPIIEAIADPNSN